LGNLQLKTGRQCFLRRVKPRLSGTLYWPTFELATPATPAAKQEQTPNVRHHFRFEAARNVTNIRFNPGQLNVVNDHPGAPMPSVWLFFFPPPATAPKTRAELDTAIKEAQEAGTLRKTRTRSSGQYSVRDLWYGEVMLAAEWPFQLCFPTTPDNRVPAGNDALPLHMILKIESRYELDQLDDPARAGDGMRPDGVGFDYLDADKTALMEIRSETTFNDEPWDGRLHVLPLLDVANSKSLETAVDFLGTALDIQDRAFLERQLRTTRMIDAWPLMWHEDFGEAKIRNWINRTLFEHSNGDVGLAADQLLWGYRLAAGSGEPRPMLPWVPLDDAFLQQCHQQTHLANSSKQWLWSRYPLRRVEPTMERGDVIELKTRLILWGNETDWVNITDETFDDALQHALVRYKHGAGLTFEQQTISAVVDRLTFEQLDRDIPEFGLADVDSQGDPNRRRQAIFPQHGFDRIVHFAIKNGLDRLHPARNVHITSGFRCLDHNRNVYLGLGRLRWRLASRAPNGIPGANGSAHAAGDLVTQRTVVWSADRGTYRGGRGDFWAPDYSNHIQGSGVDFRYAPSATRQTLVDWTALGTMGATNAHTNNHIWREPMNIGRPANRIHLDTGDIPVDNRQFVLTDDQRNGPAFSNTVTILGTITNAARTAQGYAIVQLSGGGLRQREFVADENGIYVVYGLGAQFPGPYTLTVLTNVWDEQTVNDMIPRAGDAVSRVRRTDPAAITTTVVQVNVPTPGEIVTRDIRIP